MSEHVDPRILEWWKRGGTSAELVSIRLDIFRERLVESLHSGGGTIEFPPHIERGPNRHQRRAAAARRRLSARDDLRRLRRSLGRLSARSQTAPLLLPPGEWHVYYPKA